MSNESAEMLASQLLTEHLGFQPISVIDDIINMINEIMYRCTEQLELALIQKKFDKEEEGRQQQERILQSHNDDDDVIVNEEEIREQTTTGFSYTVEDIQKGTATLESLMEHVINKNFDKFEVYAMRNILNIPADLVAGGFVRLKHHRGMEIRDNISEEAQRLDSEYERLVRELEAEIAANKVLNQMLSKFSQLLDYSKKLKAELSFIDLKSEESLKGETSTILEKLTPLRETYKFLINEVKYMYDKVESMKELLNDPKTVAFDHTEEDRYLNGRIKGILEELGFAKASKASGSNPQVQLELVQKLNSFLDKELQ
ncbi:hypothetical protein KL933_000685 [Ogataea haglerorum]|uniref:Kinetochore-associated protein MTW1 n=1 Tax=Ogataea haglerorum TaxID=1937702 RepID=A0AAN6DBA2_9ASCO|nr:uncharacterized protein KL911_003336 [Ogataea haglerorum]KAG7701624.1 hypothetical protein KL951_000080 [Ogataea haglerorum]KAG7722260.1 hypothetical protein KL913_000080 [Ogataea haglerorum]KAG7723637.1 hypothetical protein KL949_000687 [Ogataea haglerorum]KAG7730890.1 hypothetical protein KL933_000685 [Ogataea haglerorum]KAG7750890.1 hypothetical protein KL912_000023 [Ogataea haglerorum]